MEKLVYDKTHKVWMQPGAAFRQSSIDAWKKEVQRVEKSLEKVAIRKGGHVTNDYYFNNRDMFIVLLKSLMKGGYEHLYNEGREMRLEKHWYSYRLRAKYRHIMTFSKVKEGEYKISTFSHINNPKGHKTLYGWKYAPIENISRYTRK